MMSIPRSTRTVARHLAPLFGLCLLAAASVSHAASLLMISVDGMKPEYVLEADAHDLKIPYLRGMLREGSFARGVVGVWPTVTYPSHTTLITGASPAEHGVFSNLEFDPRRTFGDSWFWYARKIKVPTLWQAAHRAGLSTASVGWPVTVGATDVDFLLPEYWRINRATADLAPSDRYLMAAVARPEGSLSEMESRLGSYIPGNDPSPAGDVIKTKFAADIIKTRKPKFMTVHLSALDEEEHAHAPFSREANAELEILDADIAQLAAAMRANDKDAVVVVVSDHGFTPIKARINLYPAFVKAGLLDLEIDPKTGAVKVNGWKATLWSAGGVAAVMLKAGEGAETEAKVKTLLDSLKADNQSGIAAILDRTAIKARGGFPEAAFLIVMKSGMYAGGDPAADSQPSMDGSTGGHGFSPDYPEMRSSFFVTGSGIAQHKDLGVIDMRQIAPTVARLLSVPFPSAKAAPLEVEAAR